MQSLAEVFRDASDLLALDPEELAKIILRALPAAWASGYPQTLEGFIDYQLSGRHGNLVGDRDSFEVKQAVVEGWMVLERAGLLIPAADERNPRNRVLSRRAQQLKSEQDWSKIPLVGTLPSRLLHHSIRNDVWSMYLRGLYDAAVFQAFKEVEVGIRVAGDFEAKLVGTDLMRAAFHADTGPLTDPSLPKAEREAIAHLFAGAIGSYKNPQSHRRVEIASPDEAAEMLMLASHLLRIVDARISARAIAGPAPQSNP